MLLSCAATQAELPPQGPQPDGVSVVRCRELDGTRAALEDLLDRTNDEFTELPAMAARGERVGNMEIHSYDTDGDTLAETTCVRVRYAGPDATRRVE